MLECADSIQQHLVYIDHNRRTVIKQGDIYKYVTLKYDYSKIARETDVIEKDATVLPEQFAQILPNTINIEYLNLMKQGSLVEKEAGNRYGNASNIRLEIRYGKDDTVFELIGVVVDYIKAPQLIRITQEQIDLTRDTSQIMEFPDYVCQEIINELVMLVMENTANPRLQTHIPVTQSIANPTQQQTTTKKS